MTQATGTSTTVPQDGPLPPLAPAGDGPSPAMRALLAAVAVIALAAGALLEARVTSVRLGNVIHTRAIPDVLRVGGATLVLFGVCGYAPARMLAPRSMRAHLPLLMLPVGAAASALTMTVLGLLHVPFDVSLAVVLAAGAVAAVALRVRRGGIDAPGERAARRSGGRAAALAAPTYLVLLIFAIALIPVFRAGEATVLGQNGDAILAVGSTVLVQHAPPTATRPDLPTDAIPLLWRSKYPIFYGLAAVSKLSGMPPDRAFPVFAAAMLALVALGYFLFAHYALRARWLVALAAMGLVGADRILLYVTMHPYYNQLWGSFALPFILMFGWWFLTRPSRRSLGLFALFGAIGGFAYPLMLAFPVAFVVGVAATRWRSARRAGGGPGWIAELRVPRGRGLRLLAIPAGALVLVVVATLLRGIYEKTASAASVLLPGHSLAPWNGPVPYFAPQRFLGLPGQWGAWGVVSIAVLACAAVGLWRSPRDTRTGLTVVAVGGSLAALMFRLRSDGNLFYFKTGSFLGPILLTLATTGLAWLLMRRRVWVRGVALAGLAALAAGSALAVHEEVAQTFPQLTPQMRQLEAWGHQLPPNASVRIDLPPTGVQLWAAYVLADHPLSMTNPIRAFFPHPPYSINADYVLRAADQPPPPLGTKVPVRRNASFKLYRQPRLPRYGPDLSSRRQVEQITSVPLS